MKRGPTDGLVGMWIHDFDQRGNIIVQAEIISRSQDGYICQLYSLDDGDPSELKVVPRKQIVERMKLYRSIYEMNRAMEEHEERQFRQWQSVSNQSGGVEMH